MRLELDKYLIRFRSEIVRYTNLIKFNINNDELEYEVEKIREINPTILDIQEECKANKYLKELCYTLINSKLVQLAAIGIGVGNALPMSATTIAVSVTIAREVANSYKKLER